ncbi:hypothetical protein DPMN_021343 [Dreissena polymorpha]|uniref:Uncharacterized protein n=1 Tax=Dreissena polymorpha TaxID=45954 RepID=A0A9D4NM01_DREPO|nr:hypothetical protein DPMN_021343 [Dreissena polymorpha]
MMIGQTIHVFQRTGTTFELNQHIMKTNILKNLEFDRGIIGTNLLTKFHEGRTKNVASRVFTRKTAPPTGCHLHEDWAWNVTYTVFDPVGPIFELDRGFIGTNLLTKFHEDRKRNVASRVFTNQMWAMDGRRTKTDHKSSPEPLGELKTSETICDSDG